MTRTNIQTVKQNQIEYGLPLKILSYNELYGWTMDKIVSQVGKKNNCTFCGVFRRQALDRGAAQLGVDHIVTGHNADDIAETVLMNSRSNRGSLGSREQYSMPNREGNRADDSHERRYCKTGTLYGCNDPRRGYHQTIQAIQIRLREGNSHVCVFQEIDVFLHRVHILSRRYVTVSSHGVARTDDKHIEDTLGSS